MFSTFHNLVSVVVTELCGYNFMLCYIQLHIIFFNIGSFVCLKLNIRQKTVLLSITFTCFSLPRCFHSSGVFLCSKEDKHKTFCFYFYLFIFFVHGGEKKCNRKSKAGNEAHD